MTDIDDTETALAEMTGIENSWEGRVFARMVRAVRFLHGRLPIIGDRIKAVEDRVSALEQKVP